MKRAEPTELSYLIARQRALEVRGVGLGLRWEFLEELVNDSEVRLPFLEFTPENYMGRGGRGVACLEAVAKRFPVVSHGVSLSLGAADEPDAKRVRALGRFLRSIGALWHSDHLSFCTSGRESLHELVPIPCTRFNADCVAARLTRVQRQLGLPLCIEPITWYCEWGDSDMTEAEFVSRVVLASGCGLVLDVNNVYINAKNHNYNPDEFIASLPLDRVVEIHVAGHEVQPTGMRVDTHGESVCSEVRALLGRTLSVTGNVPVLLERDTNIPNLGPLMREVAELSALVASTLEVPSSKVALSG